MSKSYIILIVWNSKTLSKLKFNFRSIPDCYLGKLTDAKVLSSEEATAIVERHTAKLAEALQQVDNYVPQATYFTGRWSKLKQPESAVTIWDTGVDTSLLQFVSDRSVRYPDKLVKTNFEIEFPADFMYFDNPLSRNNNNCEKRFFVRQ